MLKFYIVHFIEYLCSLTDSFDISNRYLYFSIIIKTEKQMTELQQTLQNLNLSDNAKFVTVSELQTALNNTTILSEMASFGSVIQLTEPKCNKKDRVTKEPFIGKIQKLSYLPSIIVNSKYDTQYQNKLDKEGNGEKYVAGKNTMPLELSENNDFYGTYYGKGVIQYRPNPNQNSKPVTYWFLNGKLVDKNDLPDVLPKSYPSTIVWRKLYVKNIIQLKLGKVAYQTI
jgi:hypothetical protein